MPPDWVRDLTLTLTILALIFLATRQPPPVKEQVKYCPIVEWKWITVHGRRVRLWYDTYGPCHLMDRYERA